MRPTAWIILASCFANLNPSFSQNQDLEALEKDIRTQISQQTAVYGIALFLPNGQELLINAQEQMHAASTMKVPVMMRLFEMVDQGTLTLRTQVTIENEFKSIVDGSTYSITVDSEEALYKRIGSKATIEELVVAMITKSSNLATNLLIELADAEKIMTLMRQFDAGNMLVLRGVEDLKAFEAGKNNLTSAEAMLKATMAAIGSTKFSESSRAKMLEILRNQHFNDMIPAGIPASAGAKIAHKTGSISRVQHDVAIIDLPGGIRYGLAILARDFGDEREKVKQTAAAISHLVYQAVLSQKEVDP